MSETNHSHIYRISPLIRIALWSFYASLTFPLPIIAFYQGHDISAWMTIGGLGLCAIALYAALSEQVHLDESAIAIVYPKWVPQWFRKPWTLP